MRKITAIILTGLLLLFSQNNTAAIDDVQLNHIANGFIERREGAFFTLSGKNLVRATIESPLGSGRPDYSRAYAYSLIDYAFKSFWLNEQNTQANNALMEYADYYLNNPSSMYDQDNFYWSTDELCRIVEYFGTHGTKNAGLLSGTTESSLFEMMWTYTSYMSKKSDASYASNLTWHITESENHHVQLFSVLWHFTKLLKEIPAYKNQLLNDGFTPEEHYQAWNDYATFWMTERAKRGLFIEMNNETYGYAAIKGIYNFFDFGDNSLHELAKKFLDLHWALWAQEQLSGVKGGAKNRLYPGNNSKMGYLNFGVLAWYYLGIGGPGALNQNLFTFISSDYRLPPVVMDLALDVDGRGVYEITHRTHGLAVPGYYSPPDYRTRLDSAGICRYSYCSPDFIMGTAHFKARSYKDWMMISSQNRWQGVIFNSDPDTRIFPQCVDESEITSFNPHWSVQNKGCMITQKLPNGTYSHKGSPMRVFFSSKGLFNIEEKSGWVFASSKGAYAAVKCVSKSYSWKEDTFGRWLVCEDEYSPVIIQVVQQLRYNSFQEFQDKVLANPIQYENKMVRVRSVYNDDFTFYGDYSRLPMVNDLTVELEPDKVYQSPFISSAYNSGVIHIQKDNRQLRLDFTSPSTPPLSPSISYGGPFILKKNQPIAALIPTNSGGEVPVTEYGVVSTVAKVEGHIMGLAFNLDKSVLYFTENDTHQIKQLKLPATLSVLAGSGLAGSADGKATGAGFNAPEGIAVHPLTNEIYVADPGNNRIRKITADGDVVTIAGNGTAASLDGALNIATFNSPSALAFKEDGTLFILQKGDGKIRKMDASGNSVTTLTPFVATQPQCMTYYNGYLYFTEFNGNKISKVNVTTGLTSFIAGSQNPGYADGAGKFAAFNGISGITVDPSANVYVSEYTNGRIRRISSEGVVTTIAGNGSANETTDGSGLRAGFRQPCGATLDIEGNLYVGEAGGKNIRKVGLTGYSISPSLPAGLHFDSFTGMITGIPTTTTGRTVYLVDAFNSQGSSTYKLIISITDYLPPVVSYSTPHPLVVHKPIPEIKPIESPSSSSLSYAIWPDLPSGLHFDTSSGIISGLPLSISEAKNYFVTVNSEGGTYTTKLVLSVGYDVPNIAYEKLQFIINEPITPVTPLNTGGSVPAATLGNVVTAVSRLAGQPHGLAISNDSALLYTALRDVNTIYSLTFPSTVSLLAGNVSTAGSFKNGIGSAASFNAPIGIAVHPLTNDIYVADQLNHRIRKITPSGLVSTFAGTGTPGSVDGSITSATLRSPVDVVFDPEGNLYILESDRIRKADASGSTVNTLKAGIPGTAVNCTYSNGYLYISIYNLNKIDRFNISSGELITFAGNGTAGSTDGKGPAATFYRPRGLKADHYGNIYVADYSNNTVRMISSDGQVSTLAGTGKPLNKNGIGQQASIWLPASVEIDNTGNLYVGSAGGSSLRKVSLWGYSISPDLPEGLSFDPETGNISGTPTSESGALDYKVTAANRYGINTSVVNLTVQNYLSATNPAINSLKIKILPIFLSNNLRSAEIQVTGDTRDNVIVRISDLQGRIIYSERLENQLSNTIHIPAIQSGIYILMVNSTTHRQYQKFIL